MAKFHYRFSPPKVEKNSCGESVFSFVSFSLDEQRKRKEYFYGDEFLTMKDGVRGMNFIENTVASHKQGNVWVEMD